MENKNESPLPPSPKGVDQAAGKNWVPALSITERGLYIKVGDLIRIYAKETIVTGFYGSFNEGLKRWETIISTTGRGDPFERSLDVIEIQSPQPVI